jgi:lipoprotein NlpI
VEVRQSIRNDAEKTIQAETERLETSPGDEDALSRRGDAHFFLGEFKKAVADFDEMVRNNPMQESSHWRRGIACFYAGEYQRAADQFAKYHSFDNVDRENGIWRYLSQRKQLGLAEARRGLLKYEKDDREPFPDVFKLFAGTIEPREILAHIDAASIDDGVREQRKFYADLYIGLNHAVEDRDTEARESLARSTANKWAPRAGYGPKWMWHVGRLNWEQLEAKRSKQASKPSS